jgi:glucuronoarabinoxylan endo-1,4-beta-xylanase
MKRMILILVTVALSVCLFACGRPDDKAETPTETPKEETNMNENEPTKQAELTVTEAPTDTPTPTPTEAPKTDENGMYLTCPTSYLTKKEGVSYGKFERHTYYSYYCNRERAYTILLPPDYTQDKKYPVVYLLHGIFGDENSFAGDAKLPILVGNMIAEGLCEEFILVCPAMYAAGDDTAQTPAFNAEACIPYDRFPKELVENLMPHINATYSVQEGREGTNIGGFSMGGRETLYTLMLYPELFKNVCAMAPAPGMTPAKDGFMEHPGSLQEDEVRFAEGTVVPDTIIICCGTRDSVVGKFPMGYHNLFEKNGIKHIWYEVPNADHDMNTQYSGMFNFFQLIGK